MECPVLTIPQAHKQREAVALLGAAGRPGNANAQLNRGVIINTGNSSVHTALRMQHDEQSHDTADRICGPARRIHVV